MNKEQPYILIFVDWFLPGYKGGGPIQSIAGLIQALNTFAKMDIITRNHDFNVKESYPNIENNVWINYMPNVRLSYFSRGYGGMGWGRISRLTQGIIYDAIYTNSFFSFHYSIKPRLMFLAGKIAANKFIIAPRGEMLKARLIKPKKKALFLGITKILHFYDKVIWHGTSLAEVQSIYNIWGNNIKVVNISNLSPTIQTFDPNKANLKVKGKLKMVFISRIMSYKNLHFVLLALKNLSLKLGQKIELDIYGIIEDSSYWKSCQILIEQINSTEKAINYKRALINTEVVKTFSEYELFFFPTHAENYGHVIAEALRANIPLLISDTTPWQKLQDWGAGWVLPLDQIDVFSEKIVEMLEMDEERFREMKKNVSLYALEYLNKKSTINEYIQLFARSSEDKD